MERKTAILAGLVLLGLSQFSLGSDEPGFISLFDGKTLDGWKASEKPGTFRLEDGAIVANGPRSHLYYVGPVNGAKFKNFELKVDVMTRRNSNGGIYFHTQYQEIGWPDRGFEVQVNNSYEKDPRKTGSLYMVQDVLQQYVPDDQWFTERIVVNGKQVAVFVNDKQVVDWTEPDPAVPPKGTPGGVSVKEPLLFKGMTPVARFITEHSR